MKGPLWAQDWNHINGMPVAAGARVSAITAAESTAKAAVTPVRYRAPLASRTIQPEAKTSPANWAAQ